MILIFGFVVPLFLSLLVYFYIIEWRLATLFINLEFLGWKIKIYEVAFAVIFFFLFVGFLFPVIWAKYSPHRNRIYTLFQIFMVLLLVMMIMFYSYGEVTISPRGWTIIPPTFSDTPSSEGFYVVLPSQNPENLRFKEVLILTIFIGIMSLGYLIIQKKNPVGN